LVMQANLGLAKNTLEAYARALEEYLQFNLHCSVAINEASRAHIALYVHDLAHRRGKRGVNGRSMDSGPGLANATLQQKLTALRLYYDYLMEEGYRETNPIGRGRYTPGKGFGGTRERGLIPRFRKLPWIPTDELWQRILEVARIESLRNRVMLALAYDAALRREELCTLATGDIDPAHRLLHIRAETTKNRQERVVPYSTATSELYARYLQYRSTLSRARGPLFLSGTCLRRASTWLQ
jgi:site-specific recombinase XerD